MRIISILTIFGTILGFIFLLIELIGLDLAIPLTDWFGIVGIILIGISLGYLFIGRKFLELTIPVSKLNLRKREDMETLWALSAGQPKDDTLRPENSTDIYWFKYLPRKFFPIDYQIFTLIQSRMETKNLRHHYEEIPLKKYSDLFNLKVWYPLVLFTSVLLPMVLLSAALYSLDLEFSNIDLFLGVEIILCFLIILIIGVWFLQIIQSFSQTGLRYEEILEPLSSGSSYLSLALGGISLFIFYIMGADNDFITFSLDMNDPDSWWIWIAFIGFTFPLWFVNLLEGKYLSMWIVHLFYKTKSWDFISAQPLIKSEDKFSSITNIIKKLLAILGLLAIIYGLFSVISNLVKFFTTENPLVDSGTVETLINIIPGPTVLYLLIFGLGPLLILLIKPLDIIETWIYQGVYAKINSQWDPDDTKQNQLFYNDIARFPPIDSTFMSNLARITCLILTVVTITSVSTIIADLWNIPGWSQAVWLGQMTGGVVFLFSFLFSIFSLKEEKTLANLASKSKQENKNLFNEYMRAEWLIISQLDTNQKLVEMKKWVQTSDIKNGMPHLFLAFLYSKIADERTLTQEEKAEMISSYEIALKPETFILPNMKKFAKLNLEKIRKI